jgi:hypothetical protein
MFPPNATSAPRTALPFRCRWESCWRVGSSITAAGFRRCAVEDPVRLFPVGPCSRPVPWAPQRASPLWTDRGESLGIRQDEQTSCRNRARTRQRSRGLPPGSSAGCRILAKAGRPTVLCSRVAVAFDPYRCSDLEALWDRMLTKGNEGKTERPRGAASSHLSRIRGPCYTVSGTANRAVRASPFG